MRMSMTQNLDFLHIPTGKTTEILSSPRTTPGWHLLTPRASVYSGFGAPVAMSVIMIGMSSGTLRNSARTRFRIGKTKATGFTPRQTGMCLRRVASECIARPARFHNLPFLRTAAEYFGLRFRVRCDEGVSQRQSVDCPKLSRKSKMLR